MMYNSATLDAYSQLSPYLGEQQGWYAQVLLDKFNVKLNFINDSNGEMYNKLEKSGDLGDIILWGTDSGQYHPAIDKGLLLDWDDGMVMYVKSTYISVCNCFFNACLFYFLYKFPKSLQNDNMCHSSLL